MSDYNKTREELVDELSVLRHELAKLRISASERRQAAVALRDTTRSLENESQVLQSIIDSMAEGVIVADENGEVILFNPTADKLIDSRAAYASSETWLKSLQAFLPDGITPFPIERQPLLKAMRGEQSNNVEMFIRHPRVSDGSFISVSGRPLKDDKGKLKGGVMVFRDITERKRSHGALQLNSRIIESMTEGVCLIRKRDGTIMYANPSFRQMFGYASDEIIGEQVSILNAPNEKSPKECYEEIRESLQENGCWTGEIHNIRKDGTTFWSRANISSFNHPEYGEVWVSVREDITDRKRTQKALRETEARYRELVERIPDGIYRSTPEGKFIAVNSALVHMLGYENKEEVLRIDINKDLYFTPEERMAATEQLQKENGTAYISRLKKKDGSELWVEEHGLQVLDSNGQPIYYEGVLRDITERKRLEEELARSHRLETAGRVAGQIAHDFNNLLSPLSAYPMLIREELPAGHSVLEMIDEMEFTANKIAEINQQLLSLGRRGHFNMETIDLNDLIQKAVFSQNLPSEMIVRQELESNLLMIKGGAAQLMRALINLITNAREAMQEVGVLTLSTKNVYLDETLNGYKTIKRGEYVKLQITDTGYGVPPEVLDKIFDPFFTTKKMDKQRGSGLGLSVVHSTVEDHNGYITVESTLGEGTAFSLYFPVTREAEISKAVEIAKGGNERILVVDDDPIQRKVADQLLKRLGYRVHAVMSGEEAVDYVEKCPQDLLILDMVMHGIDGAETYRRILEFYPEQRAIVLSGYAMSQRVEEALRLGAGTFVAKPVTLNTLASAVRNELDRKRVCTAKSF